MADVGIKVTPEQLHALSARVNAGSAQIEGELASLRKAIAPLGSDWAGSAHGRFSQLWTEWEAGAKSVHDALVGISSLLGQAGMVYADAEAKIASSFRTM